MGIACGLIAFLVIWLTHASGSTVHLIAWGVMAIGFVILMVPERVRLWREFHGPSSADRPKR